MVTTESGDKAATMLNKQEQKKTKSLFTAAIARLNTTYDELDLESAHPHVQKMFLLDLWRLLCWVIFVVDWGLKYAYYLRTRFITAELHWMYYLFLSMRAVFIALYHLYRCCCQCYGLRQSCKRGFRKGKKAHSKIDVVGDKQELTEVS